ncbi:hypothetical protein D3C87_1192050 [compost metagenome]
MCLSGLCPKACKQLDNVKMTHVTARDSHPGQGVDGFHRNALNPLRGDIAIKAFHPQARFARLFQCEPIHSNSLDTQGMQCLVVMKLAFKNDLVSFGGPVASKLHKPMLLDFTVAQNRIRIQQSVPCLRHEQFWSFTSRSRRAPYGCALLIGVFQKSIVASDHFLTTKSHCRSFIYGFSRLLDTHVADRSWSAPTQ